MLTIEGIYDGQKIEPLKEIPFKKRVTLRSVFPIIP